MNLLDELQRWFLSQCDGGWEHGRAIRIQALDNPGWVVEIELEGTSLSAAAMIPIEVEVTENDWVHCCIKDGRFQGYGDASKLSYLLGVFLKLVHDQSLKQ